MSRKRTSRKMLMDAMEQLASLKALQWWIRSERSLANATDADMVLEIDLHRDLRKRLIALGYVSESEYIL